MRDRAIEYLVPQTVSLNTGVHMARKDALEALREHGGCPNARAIDAKDVTQHRPVEIQVQSGRQPSEDRHDGDQCQQRDQRKCGEPEAAM